MQMVLIFLDVQEHLPVKPPAAILFCESLIDTFTNINGYSMRTMGTLLISFNASLAEIAKKTTCIVFPEYRIFSLCKRTIWFSSMSATQ